MNGACAPALGLERVVVIGTSGAGKSSLAERLARLLGSRHVELDELHWGPDWTPKPLPVFRELAREAVAGERWVVAGNYGVVRDLIWPRATTIVWLDFPLSTVLARVVRRSARRLLRREVLWHGNRESWTRTLFSRESIVWWVVTTHARRRREFRALRESGRFPVLRWHVMRRPADVERLVDEVGTAARS